VSAAMSLPKSAGEMASFGEIRSAKPRATTAVFEQHETFIATSGGVAGRVASEQNCSPGSVTRCRLLALSGHPRRPQQCPLSGVKRIWRSYEYTREHAPCATTADRRSPMSISRMSRGGDRRPVYDAAWAALRSQCGFARNNDAGGEINGSASGAVRQNILSRVSRGRQFGGMHGASVAARGVSAFLTVPPA
jgi:hypothetical protein